MVALVRGADLEQQLPSCPDWDLRSLLKHTGEGHRFTTDVMRAAGLAADSEMAGMVRTLGE